MKDVTGYATSVPTSTMEAFADYLVSEVFGGTLPDGIDEKSFRKGVALGGSTRGYFQASEYWKKDSRNYLANVDANRAKVATERAAKAKLAREKAEKREADAIAKLADAVAAAKAKVEALAEVANESAPSVPESAPSVPVPVPPKSGKRAA